MGTLVGDPIFRTQDMLILGMVVMAIVLVMASLRRRLRKRDRVRAVDTESLEGHRRRVGMARDVEDLMVQLEELSRRIGAQIDTRFKKLETVVGDADQRIASLEALVRAAGRIPKVDAIVADPEEDGGEPVPSDALGRDLTPEPDGRERQSIYDLADAGKTPVEIAEETGRDTGEVELILALRRGSTPG